ncbi:CRISPR-associated endoribonuclease Cas6 [Synergistales bacterium]|nr:CRISPR-associated endoribonuclease Cas6 [Synergistales bacterium]
MHITIQINSNESSILNLPVSNLHLFQAFLYNLLPPERAAFLHDRGYRVDGRPMKLFAMSWPISNTKPRPRGDRIEYDLPVRLVVSTPVPETLDGFANGAFKNDSLRIGNNSVFCESVEAVSYTVAPDDSGVTVRTLSPITCYSQMQRADGRKYTVYFHPSSVDFSESVYNNLLKKFRAFHPSRETPSGHVTIRPVGRVAERVAKFDEKNSFPIKGWEGQFHLMGPIELLQIGVDCGLGAKNSSGWGCVGGWES